MVSRLFENEHYNQGENARNRQTNEYGAFQITPSGSLARKKLKGNRRVFVSYASSSCTQRQTKERPIPSDSTRPSAAPTSLYVHISLPFISFIFSKEFHPVSNLSKNLIFKTFRIYSSNKPAQCS